MTHEYYEALDAMLRALYGEVSNLISTQDSDEVLELMNHAEYGLALTWLADSLVDAGAAVSPIICERFGQIAEIMGIRDELPLQMRANEC